LSGSWQYALARARRGPGTAARVRLDSILLLFT
jgi:hypothetical protein